MVANEDQWRVQSFGRDCLGNITGYVVVRGYGWSREESGTFLGKMYEFGSFDRAYKLACTIRDQMNAAAQLVEA